MNSATSPLVLLLGAGNTKGEELGFLRAQIEANGCRCGVIDTALAPGGDKAGRMQEKTAELRLLVAGHVAREAHTAVLGIGGGVGSWIALAIMQELPIGVGKVLVSTLPFDPRPEVAKCDVVIIPSIVDIQGLNPTLRMILRRAARIACALAANDDREPRGKPVVAITGLGITTPAVQCCQRLLESAGFEVATFHAAGFGSRAYEKFLRAGEFCGAIDLTTHELNGTLFGGVAIAEENRLTTAAQLGIPQVVCPGGLDILGRGPIETLSDAEKGRPHYRHSPKFTHLRASAAEMTQSATLLAERLRGGSGPCAILIPGGGFSHADHAGSPMWNPEANRAFTATLRQQLPRVEIVELPDHINSPAFGAAVVAKLRSLLRPTSTASAHG